MKKHTCGDCQVTVEAIDRDGLVAKALDHYSSLHPQWGLNQMAIENYLDAEERMTGGTERLPTIGDIEIKAVTRDQIADVLDFFDKDAYAGNPAWAGCYCMFFHRDDPQLNGANSWRQNRADIEERLQTGETVAYVAYVDGKVAAWCNASPRSAYPTRRKGVDDDKVGVVACFVIAPPYRRHGLARRLLDAAVEGFRSLGMEKVEAHPVLGTDADAPNYHGPLQLYMDAGFKEVSRDDRFALVEKPL